MVGPPAAARALARNPLATMALWVTVALVTVWAAIAACYLTDWPVGFFVGTVGAGWYAVARAVAACRPAAPDAGRRTTAEVPALGR